MLARREAGVERGERTVLWLSSMALMALRTRDVTQRRVIPGDVETFHRRHVDSVSRPVGRAASIRLMSTYIL